MSNREIDQIDEFESRFKRAARDPFQYQDIPISSLTLVTDGTADDARAQESELFAFLPHLETATTRRHVLGADYDSVSDLLQFLSANPTDLIVTSRHLQERELVPRHSLGVFVDVLTQATTVPVLLLPGAAGNRVSLNNHQCRNVMVVTDHIAGDSRLVNYGASFCPQRGELWLCHVEDDAVFNRYIRAIERIPEIETEQARQLINDQLLSEAEHFIESCIEELKQESTGTEFHTSITRGHHLKEYGQLIESHDIDLLVMNTKDDEQLAMHGMAYSIAVEMIDVAQLLL